MLETSNVVAKHTIKEVERGQASTRRLSHRMGVEPDFVMPWVVAPGSYAERVDI